MELPLSAAIAQELVVLDEVDSTNRDLIDRDHSVRQPHLSVVVTDNQTAGRGRLGREWIAPRGKSLAVSVLIRPRSPSGVRLNGDAYGWVPLIAGVAMATAIRSLVSASRVGLKWPNDVQIDGLKVSGILAELIDGGSAVVIGAGVNLSIGVDELPTATSTSLGLTGAQSPSGNLADDVLSAYLSSLRGLVRRFEEANGDAEVSGIRRLVTESCTTIGQRVLVDVPGGDKLVGMAVGIDGSGRLEVRTDQDDVLTAVAAGDVTHVRYE
jgi:BirA family biotin operon repressor/biotin-[acetyl-CoA-carboxylase] ligase